MSGRPQNPHIAGPVVPNIPARHGGSGRLRFRIEDLSFKSYLRFGIEDLSFKRYLRFGIEDLSFKRYLRFRIEDLSFKNPSHRP